jgi:flavin-dependent dehydrogenase
VLSTTGREVLALAEMVGTTRSRVSFLTKKFRTLGFIEYNGGLEINVSSGDDADRVAAQFVVAAHGVHRSRPPPPGGVLP